MAVAISATLICVSLAQNAWASEPSGKCIYLANPLGFSETGTQFIQQVLLPELNRLGRQVINPFDLVDVKRIQEIRAMPAGSARIEAWRALNAEIGKTNEKTIDSCDIVFAVLDGADVDSGTASEIGYAYAKQKLIMGYRGDFRLSSDNEGGLSTYRSNTSSMQAVGRSFRKPPKSPKLSLRWCPRNNSRRLRTD